jgi:hypothetical protein
MDRIAKGRLDPAKCWRNHPAGGVACTLPVDHIGPHLNVATNRMWPNLGNGQCESVSQGHLCNKDKGHDGQHQNGNCFWD